MITTNKTEIIKDLPNKALHIKREFSLPLKPHTRGKHEQKPVYWISGGHPNRIKL